MTIIWPSITVEISFDSLLLRKTVAEQSANWTDITAYVQRWSYSRGRQRQLGRAEVGTAEITLDNEDGRFDPENSASPYYDGHASEASGLGMTPRRHVRIRATHDGTTYGLFYGYVTAWEPREMDRSATPTVRVSLEDILGWIGRGEDWRIVTAQTRPGLAIYDFLTSTDVDFATDLLSIDEGALTTVTLSSSVHNLLSKVQEYAETEPSAVFFVDGDGRFVYHDRQHRFAFDRSLAVQATFNNAPAEDYLPYTNVVYRRDLTTYANLVTVTSAAGGAVPQTAESILGVNRYGPRAISQSSRLSSDAGALVVAKNRLTYHNRFDGVHETLIVDHGGGSSELMDALLRLTISDKIRVTERLYPGSRTRTLDSFVEGMSVAVDHERLSWRTTYRLSRAYPAIFPTIGGKGVAFPSNPIVNDTFHRTDLGLLCYYDGTRWLTVHEESLSMTPDVGYAVNTTTAPSSYLMAPYRGVGVDSMYITQIVFSGYVATTNNSSNYWNFSVLTSAGTTVWSFSTQGFIVNTRTATRTSPGAVYTLSYIRLNLDSKTGSPGALNGQCIVHYRRVVT